jgi:hypothetical protein
MFFGSGDLFHREVMRDLRPERGCLATGWDRLAVSDF